MVTNSIGAKSINFYFRFSKTLNDGRTRDSSKYGYNR